MEHSDQMLRAGLLLSTIIFAACSPVPKLVANYFDTQFFATLLIEGVLWAVNYDANNTWYVVGWSIGTFAMLAATCLVVLWATPKKRIMLLSSPAALLFACYLAFTAKAFSEWTVLTEFAVLTWAGFTLLFVWPFESKERQIVATLSVLWLMLAAFDYGYMTHITDTWTLLNKFLPTWLVVAAFAWIGVYSFWLRGDKQCRY